MRELFQKCSVAYLAGALGGLAYAGVAWACSHWRLFEMFSVNMNVGGFSWPFVAGHMLTGSLWGLLFVLLSPALRARGIVMGLVISLFPAAYTLLVQYPQQGLGMFGSEKGAMAWLFVLLFNAAWGLVAGGIYSSHYRA